MVKLREKIARNLPRDARVIVGPLVLRLFARRFTWLFEKDEPEKFRLLLDKQVDAILDAASQAKGENPSRLVAIADFVYSESLSSWEGVQYESLVMKTTVDLARALGVRFLADNSQVLLPEWSLHRIDRFRLVLSLLIYLKFHPSNMFFKLANLPDKKLDKLASVLEGIVLRRSLLLSSNTDERAQLIAPQTWIDRFFSDEPSIYSDWVLGKVFPDQLSSSTDPAARFVLRNTDIFDRLIEMVHHVDAIYIKYRRLFRDVRGERVKRVLEEALQLPSLLLQIEIDSGLFATTERVKERESLESTFTACFDQIERSLVASDGWHPDECARSVLSVRKYLDHPPGWVWADETFQHLSRDLVILSQIKP